MTLDEYRELAADPGDLDALWEAELERAAELRALDGEDAWGWSD